MKSCTLITIVATAFAGKALADCFATKLGYPCCSNNSQVYYTDSDGEWGVENGNWCGISGGCWSTALGYPCCKSTSKVEFRDNDGEWGVENGNWCGIAKNNSQPQNNNPPVQQGTDWSNMGGFGQQGGQQGGFDFSNMGGFGGQQGGQQGGFDFSNFDWSNMGGFGGQQGGQQGGFDWGNMGGFGGQQGGQQGGFDWGNMGGFGGQQGGQQQWGGDQQQQGGQQQGPSAPASNIDCSGKTLKSNTNLNINGRKVIVKFPSGYRGDQAVPLLINFHPIGGSASGWENQSQTARAALNDGAIVAFMDGAQSPGMGQAWNVGPCCTDADDVTYTRNFIKEITSKACVDPKRIYAAGFSMGGGMSNYAGCMLADVIAAAAPSAFDLSKEIVDSGKCKPARPFPILNFRGTSDNIVMYNGGLSQVVQGKPITFLGAKNNLKEWAKMNGCTGEPKANTPGSNCEMYENCNGGVKVGLCTINGGGHSEGNGQMGWNFLKQFSL